METLAQETNYKQFVVKEESLSHIHGVFLKFPWRKKHIWATSSVSIEDARRKAQLYTDQEVARKAALNASAKETREKRVAENKVAAEKVAVGQIYYSSWGYEQTNIDFYQVIAKSGQYATLQQVCGDRPDEAFLATKKFQAGADYDYTVPAPNNFKNGSKPFRALIQAGFKGEAGFSLNSYSSCTLYDGQPKLYSWGH